MAGKFGLAVLNLVWNRFNLTLPGYTFFGQNRQDCYNNTTYLLLKHSSGGGVGVFINTRIRPEVTILPLDTCELEYIGLKTSIHMTGECYIICCIYIPPKLNCLKQLEFLITGLSTEESVILMGDFNDHAPTIAVNAFLEEHGFLQQFTEPTTTHANKNILDHCYIRNIHTPIQSGVLPIYYSFHEGIYLVFKQ